MALNIIESLGPNDTGATIALAEAAEGKPSYSYSWAWVTQPQGVSIGQVDPQRIRLVTQGAFGGVKTGRIRVTATDQLGQTATDDVTFTVSVPELALTLDAYTISESLDATEVGATVITASAAEGVTPYSYSFDWLARSTTALEIEELSATTFSVKTVNCPGGNQTGVVRVTVTDDLGQTDYADVSVTVTVPVMTVALTPDPYEETIVAEQTGTTLITATVSNGVSPYIYTFSWETQPDALITINDQSANTLYLDVGALADGEYEGVLRVIVTDSIGQTAIDTVSVTVTVQPENLPEIYIVNDRSATSWLTSVDEPDGFTPADDLVIAHDGWMTFFADSRRYDYNAGFPTLANRTVTQPVLGNSAAVFGKRQPDDDLTVYGQRTVAIGTLSSAAAFSTGLQSGSGSVTGNAITVAAARNVYRGTNASRRVIGSPNADLTGGPFSTVTVPGVTAPNDNSLLIMFSLFYSGIGRWYENGKDNDEWTYDLDVALGLIPRQMQWKLVPAGPTGDLSFTIKLSGVTQSVYKRLCWFVCIDSDTTP